MWSVFHYIIVASDAEFGECTMFFLVLIDEECVTEVLFDCTLSAIEFTSTIPALVLDFIGSMMTVINPSRQMNKATPRQTAEIRADLYSELPEYIHILNEFTVYWFLLEYIVLTADLEYSSIQQWYLAQYSSNNSTDHSPYGKCACATISWYVSTSDIGVVGSSGTAATVWC